MARSDKAQGNRWAKAVAEMLHENYHHWHRGAVHIGDGCRALFGNDGYGLDTRAKAEVSLVKKKLKEKGIEVAGFGVGPGNYTWVLIVKHPRTKELERLVWEAWFEVCGLPDLLRKAA